jgi:predicted transcriptional regulator
MLDGNLRCNALIKENNIMSEQEMDFVAAEAVAWDLVNSLKIYESAHSIIKTANQAKVTRDNLLVEIEGLQAQVNALKDEKRQIEAHNTFLHQQRQDETVLHQRQAERINSGIRKH